MRCSYYRQYISSVDDTADFEHDEATINTELHSWIKEEYLGQVGLNAEADRPGAFTCHFCVMFTVRYLHS